MAENIFTQNISNIYKKMAHAAMRAGRQAEEVTLIAVSKTVPVSEMRAAHDAGIRLFGESRVQEAIEKATELSGIADGIRWHMIGHLQRNKAKAAVGLFELIHSVDSLKLMEDINRHAKACGKVQRVLIEVKLSHEESKHGAEPNKIMGLLDEAGKLKNISVDGLMTIPPFFDRPEEARPYFRRLRELRDRARDEGHDIKELSMGMTGDFEVAIEEGATMVRVGTAIFGERDYQ